MNHQKIYEDLIEKTKNKNRIKHHGTYYENHHILPRCLNGNDEKENLVLLTAKEHYICHKLLIYIYKENRKIAGAFFRMTFDKKNKHYISLRDYAYAKELNSIYCGNLNTIYKKGKTYEEQMIKTYGKVEGIKKAMKYKNKIGENTKGEKNPMYGRNFYDIWIKKFGKEIADEKYKQWYNKILKNKSGEKHPMFGKHHSEESKQKNRESHLGKHHSEKTKIKMSKAWNKRKEKFLN